MALDFSRESYLSERLNQFLVSRWHLPEDDYYSKLDLESLLELKSVLTDINNIFTLKVTMSFASWLCQKFDLTQQESEKIKEQILITKPSANGFDVEITSPIPIVAEVKCNVPINRGIVFGSAQRSGIREDIHSLLNGKVKSNISPSDFFKFMVFLDLPEARKAVEHLLSHSMYADTDHVILGQDTEIISKSRLYIAFIGF